jgi:DNA polymerase V
MEAIDRINRTFGRQTIHIGSEALSNHWKMRAKLKSPAYTTRWDELPRVKAN